jgi:cell division protein FtsL
MPNLNPITILGSFSARLSKPPGSQQQPPQEKKSRLNSPEADKEFTQGEKMHRTLLSFSELPLDLLYDHGPRAQDDGLGWVPLNPGMQRLHADSLMTLDDDGLHFNDLVVYPGYRNGRSKEYIKLFKLDLSTVKRQKLVLTSRSPSYNAYTSIKQEVKEVKQEIGQVKQEVEKVTQEVGEVTQEVGELGNDESGFKGKHKRTFQTRKEDVCSVEFLRPPKEVFAINKLTTLAIVCEYQRTSGLEIQGACLEVIPRVCPCPKFEDFDTPLQHLEECKWRTHGLYCSYVCPVRILPAEGYKTGPKDILRARCSNIFRYKVTLKCG